MPDWLAIIFLGIIEGVTEFLPISSTGHLILAGALLGFDDEKAKVFDIAIQTGAIFAVVLVFWEKIRSTVMALPSQRMARRFAVNVLIAFFPAVLLGLLFGKAIKAHLFTPWVVATTFIVGGFIILWAERRQAHAAAARVDSVDHLTWRDALKVDWDPSLEVLTIHKYRVLRDGKPATWTACGELPGQLDRTAQRPPCGRRVAGRAHRLGCQRNAIGREQRGHFRHLQINRDFLRPLRSRPFADLAQRLL